MGRWLIEVDRERQERFSWFPCESQPGELKSQVDHVESRLVMSSLVNSVHVRW